MSQSEARIPLAASHREPIAVISLACRFPGAADTPEDLWNMLVAGKHAVQRVPEARWSTEQFFSSSPDEVGKSYSEVGCFLHGLQEFDADFFEINPIEASAIDPQGRLLFETSWEAFERAGLSAQALNGSQTGVYVGMRGGDYQRRTMQEPCEIDAYSLLGTLTSALAARLSYWLSLQGPNVAIDSACSSSLLAVHLACEGLARGECSLALAAGVNVLLDPHMFIYLSRLGALSRRGQSRPFSVEADGFVRGEGCGVVLLKRLSDCERDGDRVLAVIRGSAVNQDGRRNGFTAPNGAAQTAVLERALHNATMDPQAVDYVECNAAGSKMGDLIEVSALLRAYCGSCARQVPLTIGSVKGNIGHQEAAAGIAGLIKTVLALQHRMIPPSLGCEPLNPLIPWGVRGLRVAAAAEPWPVPNARPRRAGVSSFGLSGTNVHMVLEEAPERVHGVRVTAPRLELDALPIFLSAKSLPALQALATRWADWMDTHSASLHAISAASVARSEFSERAAILARTRADLQLALRALAAGAVHPGLLRGTAKGRGKLIVALRAQDGKHAAAAARRLLTESAVFGATVDACDRVVGGEAVRAFLSEREGALRSAPRHTSFALALAYVELLKSLGAEADDVLGFGDAELAARVATGAMSLADACSQLKQSPPAGPRDALAVERAEEVALARAIEGSCGFLIEVTPESEHSPVVARLCETRPAPYVALVASDERGLEGLLRALIECFLRGASVVFRPGIGCADEERPKLPTYAFQRVRHWREPQALTSVSAAAASRSPTTPIEREADPAPLRVQLAALPRGVAQKQVLQLVQTALQGVLALPSGATLDTERTLQSLGMDSLLAVQFRNRLQAITGLPLPVALAFDYPTPERITEMLIERIADGSGAGGDEATEAEAALRWTMDRISAEHIGASGLLQLLIGQAEQRSRERCPWSPSGALPDRGRWSDAEADALLDSVLGGAPTHE